MKINRTEVLVLVPHLLISLAIIGVYVYTAITGHQDETLKTVLTVIIGYWFGSMGGHAITQAQNTTQQKKVEKEKKVV